MKMLTLMSILAMALLQQGPYNTITVISNIGGLYPSCLALWYVVPWIWTAADISPVACLEVLEDSPVG